jgi:four helix bundle protein
LHAWQEARAVTLGAIELARDSWKPHAAALFAQLQRASLSVQLNIAEGYTYGHSPTYTKHLRIAYGSAVETGELLEIALEANVIPSEPGTKLLARNRRSQRLLVGMLRARKSGTPEKQGKRENRVNGEGTA